MIELAQLALFPLSFSEPYGWTAFARRLDIGARNAGIVTRRACVVGVGLAFAFPAFPWDQSVWSGGTWGGISVHFAVLL
jgi:hypothetical protein